MALRAPPDPFPPFNTQVLPAGTSLVRMHAPGFDGAQPNPCLGKPTRFAPLQQPGGACLPTLYAADSLECAVFESVFHDVPHDAAAKFVPLGNVISRTISLLATTADLTMARLHEPDLNRLGLTRTDLIDTPAASYHLTARWAEAFHRAGQAVAGLAWTSRLCDPGMAFLFFADRLPADAFTVTGRIDVGLSADHLRQIRGFGRRAGITLTI